MINRKDVIRIKVPFPDISSALAVNSHMYICQNRSGTEYHFVKCQTLKPYMLQRKTMRHYWDEHPDISRNPFNNATRIDCDKLFQSQNVEYDEHLKTPKRPDVCDDTMANIEAELRQDGFSLIHINESELLQLNSLISPV